MALDEGKRERYEMILQTTRDEIEDLNRSIDAELTKVREDVNFLRDEQKHTLTMYQSACAILGVQPEIAEDDEDEDDDEYEDEDESEDDSEEEGDESEEGDDASQSE